MYNIYIQSGASRPSKYGDAYFSAVYGPIKDPIAAPEPYEHLKPKKLVVMLQSLLSLNFLSKNRFWTNTVWISSKLLMFHQQKRVEDRANVFNSLFSQFHSLLDQFLPGAKILVWSYPDFEEI